MYLVGTTHRSGLLWKADYMSGNARLPFRLKFSALNGFPPFRTLNGFANLM